MAEACVKHDPLPWQVSFKGPVQLIDEFMPHFLNSSDEKSEKLYNEMPRLVVKNKVGNMPGRVEPIEAISNDADTTKNCKNQIREKT